MIKRFLMLVFGLLYFCTSQAVARQAHDETPIELSGFSISESYEISDDEPLELDSPMVKKLLYRIQRTSPETRNRYSKYSIDVSWNDVVEKTEAYRLWVFDRPARLTRIEKHPFQNVNIDEEVKGVFVCHCELTDPASQTATKFIALSRTIPSSLKPNVELEQPVRVTGFLYSRVLSPDKPNESLPVFVIDRLAWYPQQSNENVPPAVTRLAKHGFDVGLLDSVRQNNTKPLANKDAEAFFQFIAAVDKMEPESEISSEPKLGFSALMQNANSNFGHAARVRGIVRTCSVIPIQHPDIQERLGITKYYQLMLFPDLNGAKVVIKNKNGEQLDYRKFPVTICCTSLPEGMQPKDLERKQFEVDGYFYRFWKYQSDKTDAAKATGQVSPLIIAKSPTLIPSKRNQLNMILTIFVIALIAGIAILLCVYRVADKRRKTPGAEILSSLPDRIDLAGVEE